MSWRDQIASEALTWVGTKYHHKGRIKGVGVDCGGLIYEVYKKVMGLPHEPFPDNYAEDWGLHKDNNEIYLDFIMPYVVPTDRLLVGDLVMIQFGRSFAHGTIYIGNNKVVHAYGRTGSGSVVVSKLEAFKIGNASRPMKQFALDSKWHS